MPFNWLSFFHVVFSIGFNAVTAHLKAAVAVRVAATEYQRKRKEEYPSWEDQMDKIYHSGIDAWKADIKAIKDKYPKP